MWRAESLMAAACALSCCACDYVFHLSQVDSDAANSVCLTAVGHDEDGDRIDDGCDPCPFADDNVTDDDRDGITGICDPDPTTVNERVMFSGLNAETASMFAFDGGTFTQDAFHTQAAVNASLLWPTTVDNVWITTGVDVVSLGATQYREVGIVVDAAPSKSRPIGMFCVLGKNGTTNYNEMYTYNGTAETSLKGSSPMIDMTTFVGGTIRAAFGRTATPQLACSFTLSSTVDGIMGSRADTPVPGGIALFTEDTEAAFRFVFVVTRP
ncbi:MAG TPA: hypothetical protein VLB44_07930 [Kofleriaceae bacterium]|nr:hypothetical protein [Kofleriaceae bacterium]